MFVSILVLHIVVSISLVLIVLLQTGRGAELGAAFGGTGQASYGRTQGSFITKFTTGVATVFMLTSLSLALLSTERPSTSILSQMSATPPAATEAAAPTAVEATAAPAAGSADAAAAPAAVPAQPASAQ